MSRRFPSGADHDAETESIEHAEERAHEAGECNPVTCIIHIAEREQAELEDRLTRGSPRQLMGRRARER